MASLKIATIVVGGMLAAACGSTHSDNQPRSQVGSSDEVQQRPHESEASGCTQGRVCDVSLVRLLAVPETYDGVVVRTQGFLTTGYEDAAVYLSRDDAEFGLLLNRVKLVLPDDGKGEVVGYSTIEGTFRAGRDDSIWAPGLLTEVSRIAPMHKTPKPVDPN